MDFVDFCSFIVDFPRVREILFNLGRFQQISRNFSLWWQCLLERTLRSRFREKHHLLVQLLRLDSLSISHLRLKMTVLVVLTLWIVNQLACGYPCWFGHSLIAIVAKADTIQLQRLDPGTGFWTLFVFLPGPAYCEAKLWVARPAASRQTSTETGERAWTETRWKAETFCLSIQIRVGLQISFFCRIAWESWNDSNLPTNCQALEMWNAGRSKCKDSKKTAFPIWPKKACSLYTLQGSTADPGLP